jgi:hypothetical protein
VGIFDRAILMARLIRDGIDRIESWADTLEEWGRETRHRTYSALDSVYSPFFQKVQGGEFGWIPSTVTRIREQLEDDLDIHGIGDAAQALSFLDTIRRQIVYDESWEDSETETELRLARTFEVWRNGCTITYVDPGSFLLRNVTDPSCDPDDDDDDDDDDDEWVDRGGGRRRRHIFTNRGRYTATVKFASVGGAGSNWTEIIGLGLRGTSTWTYHPASWSSGFTMRSPRVSTFFKYEELYEDPSGGPVVTERGGTAYAFHPPRQRVRTGASIFEWEEDGDAGYEHLSADGERIWNFRTKYSFAGPPEYYGDGRKRNDDGEWRLWNYWRRGGTTDEKLYVPILPEQDDDEDPKKKPPPQNDEEEDDVDCCNRVRDNWEMLRKIYRVTGARDDFPVELPETLRTTEEGNSQISLRTTNEILLHLLTLFDEAIGEFPLRAKIIDKDKGESGEEVEVELPNVAETLAELYLLNVQERQTGGLVFEFLSKLAAEVMSVKSATLTTQGHVKAHTSFLGVKGNVEIKEIDTNFNFEDPRSIQDFLTSTKEGVSYFVAEDTEDLVSYLQQILLGIGILKEVHTRSPGAVSETLRAVTDLLDPEFFARGNFDVDWENFLELINTPGFLSRNPFDSQPKGENIDLDLGEEQP